jgi:ketol-acid reductoisomerase
VQSPGQSLNLKDNGFRVIIGQSKQFPEDWDRAVKDGWKPGVDLFEIEEAVEKGTVIEVLIADAAHKAVWPLIKASEEVQGPVFFTRFFHSLQGSDGHLFLQGCRCYYVLQGSVTSLRQTFFRVKHHASSPFFQDANGRAKDRTLAIGTEIGAFTSSDDIRKGCLQ